MTTRFQEAVAHTILLRRRRPIWNEDRYYAMSVTTDLFGSAVLLRQWGRAGTIGKQRLELHVDLAGAEASLLRMAGAKRKRYYVDA